ncbi:response regulator [Anaerolineales bacterium HSG6]|nr:response regulator [Anaerolineales bacterium HSG6]
MAKKGGHILVVDDNRMNRIKLSRGVEQHGYTVELAENGMQALEKLRSTSFDLVLLDTKMPDMDGYQLLTELKQDDTLKAIQVIMTIPAAEIQDVTKYLKAGAVDYIPQAFDAIMLKTRIEAYVDKRLSSGDVSKGVSILVVDDDQTTRLKISRSIQEQGHRIQLAESGEQALQVIKTGHFDVILLDVIMPGINGFETCRRLKDDPATSEIPVLFMTSLTATEDKIKGFDVGAVDYITKPIQQEELLARLNAHLRIRTLTQNLASSYATEQKRRQLSDTLREVAKIVSITLRQDQVLDLILNQLERVVTYDQATITLLMGQELRLAARRHKIEKITREFNVPIGHFPLNQVALEEKYPILVADTRRDRRWQNSGRGVPTRSFINAPLLVQNRPIGLLGISRYDDIPYTNDDAQTVFAFAMQVAIALENARLAERTQTALHETRGLLEGTEAILDATEMPEICRNLAVHLRKLVQADETLIYLVNHDEKQISVTEQSGTLKMIEPVEQYEALMTGDSATVFESDQPLRISPDNSQTTDSESDEQAATVLLPLASHGEVIGLVTIVAYQKNNGFTNRDIELLMTLASQAATGIQRKRAEVALQQANNELHKLNADKDKFFSIMAHDLRGPFMPLIGASKLLNKAIDVLTPEETKELTASIHRTAKNTHNLLENLLQWSQLQMGRLKYRPQSVDMLKVIDKNIELLTENATSKEIILKSQAQPELFAYADIHMIDTVIRNLVSNALKFTPNGGTITVIAQPQNGSSTIKMPVEQIEVNVADTGVGISEEDLAKLFRLDVHHTTHGTNDEHGSGLGLLMCQEMVEKNGGKIWVESTQGEGTIFTFTVPIAKEATG